MRNINEMSMNLKVKRHSAALVAGMVLFASLSIPVFAENEQQLLICDKTAHTHTDACYTQTLVCELPEEAPQTYTQREYTAVFIPHVHTDACLDAEGRVICGYAENEYVHRHNEWCRDSQGNLVCGLEERLPETMAATCAGEPRLVCGLCEGEGGHHHKDDCYIERGVLACGKEETEGHVHTATCYTDIMDYVCGLEEGMGHTHTEDCYTEVDQLICGMEEDENHTHGPECYAKALTLTCGQEEAPAHFHTMDCYGMVHKLTCGCKECESHTHTADCYELRKVLSCDLEESDGHHHTEACYAHDENEQTVRQPHHHTDECFAVIDVNGEQRVAAICGMVEVPEFVSTPDCWTEYEVTVAGHTHNEACYVRGEQPVCGLEEHVHTEACFAPVEEQKAEDVNAEEGKTEENAGQPEEKNEIPANDQTENAAEVAEEPQQTGDENKEESDDNAAAVTDEQAANDAEGGEEAKEENAADAEGGEEAKEENVADAEDGEEAKEENAADAEGGEEAKEENAADAEGGEEAKEENAADAEGGEEAKEENAANAEGGEEEAKEENAADAEDGEEAKEENAADAEGGEEDKKDEAADAEDGETITETAEEGEEQPESVNLTAEGEGFTVSAEKTEEIPAGAVLTVRMIEDADELRSQAEALINERNAAGDSFAYALEQASFFTVSLEDGEGGEIALSESLPIAVQPEGAYFFRVTPEGMVLTDLEEAAALAYAGEVIGFGSAALRQVAPVTLTVEGEDYSVEATYGPDACLPADTQLRVREIEPGTAEYELYSGKTEDVLSENWETIAYARFFDITFISDGQRVQPAILVDVRINLDRIPEEDDDDMKAVRFAQSGVEFTSTASSDKNTGGAGEL